VKRMFSLFSLDGWQKFGPNWDALDGRMKQTIARTTQG
jgi:spermidine/putrescine transport system substrate-binding protein